jgi:hypothetical protein
MDTKLTSGMICTVVGCADVDDNGVYMCSRNGTTINTGIDAFHVPLGALILIVGRVDLARDTLNNVYNCGGSLWRHEVERMWNVLGPNGEFGWMADIELEPVQDRIG